MIRCELSEVQCLAHGSQRLPNDNHILTDPPSLSRLDPCFFVPTRVACWSCCCSLLSAAPQGMLARLPLVNRKPPVRCRDAAQTRSRQIKILRQAHAAPTSDRGDHHYQQMKADLEQVCSMALALVGACWDSLTSANHTEFIVSPAPDSAGLAARSERRRRKPLCGPQRPI